MFNKQAPPLDNTILYEDFSAFGFSFLCNMPRYGSTQNGNFFRGQAITKTDLVPSLVNSSFFLEVYYQPLNPGSVLSVLNDDHSVFELSTSDIFVPQPNFSQLLGGELYFAPSQVKVPVSLLVSYDHLQRKVCLYVDGILTSTSLIRTDLKDSNSFVKLYDNNLYYLISVGDTSPSPQQVYNRFCLLNNTETRQLNPPVLDDLPRVKSVTADTITLEPPAFDSEITCRAQVSLSLNDDTYAFKDYCIDSINPIITGLNPGTDYDVRLIYKNNDGLSEGQILHTSSEKKPLKMLKASIINSELVLQMSEPVSTKDLVISLVDFRNRSLQIAVPDQSNLHEIEISSSPRTYSDKEPPPTINWIAGSIYADTRELEHFSGIQTVHSK